MPSCLEELWNVNLKEEVVLDDPNYDGWMVWQKIKETGNQKLMEGC
jgi:hypothetical protein